MFACLADWLCRQLPERGVYNNAKEAFLALLGYSVGLGNFWRFPYLSYKYGGATFLIAYSVCLGCVGLPLAMMELCMGQYLGLGPTHLFSYLCPILSGVGWGMILHLSMISVYYNVIMSWSLFYLGGSFMPVLPWSHCSDDENDCVRHSVNESYKSADNYFKNTVLNLPREKDDNPFELQLWMVLCLAVAWMIVAVCLVQGIRHTGKLFYVTVIYPYVVLLCLFGINYEHINAEEWIKNMTGINYTKLMQPEIYSVATSQVIYSLGVGHCAVMVSSHNQLHHNVVRDTFLMCLVDILTSVFSTQVLFSLSVSISPEMVEDSNGISSLVFKIFSAMLARANSSLWAFLFFSMIFALGFDSLLLMVAGVTTTIFDQFPHLRPYHPIIVVSTCTIFFLLGLTMCTRNGITVFNLLNDNIAKQSLLFLTLLEILIVSYVYGYRKMLKLMKEDLKVWVPLPVCWFFTLTWSIITPLCLALLCGYVLYSEDWTAPTDFSIICGRVISFGPMFLVPIFALYKLCTKGEKESLKDLVSPKAEFYTARFREDNWEPAPPNGIPMQHYGYRVDQENWI